MVPSEELCNSCCSFLILSSKQYSRCTLACGGCHVYWDIGMWLIQTSDFKIFPLPEMEGLSLFDCIDQWVKFCFSLCVVTAESGSTLPSQHSGTTSPDLFDSQHSSMTSGKQSAARKTPESFLGPNAALVNLDSLVSKPPQPVTSLNPFLAPGLFFHIPSFFLFYLSLPIGKLCINSIPFDLTLAGFGFFFWITSASRSWLRAGGWDSMVSRHAAGPWKPGVSTLVSAAGLALVKQFSFHFCTCSLRRIWVRRRLLVIKDDWTKTDWLSEQVRGEHVPPENPLGGCNRFLWQACRE